MTTFDPRNKVGVQQLNPHVENNIENLSSQLDLYIHANDMISHITGYERRKWNETESKCNDYTDFQFESIIGQFNFKDNKKTLVNSILDIETSIRNLIISNDKIYNDRFTVLENRASVLEVTLKSRCDAIDNRLDNLEDLHNKDVTEIKADITAKNKTLTDRIAAEEKNRASGDTAQKSYTDKKISELTTSVNTISTNLTTAINNEANVRAAGDANQKSYTDSKIAIVNQSISDLNLDISNKISTAISNLDTKLSKSITDKVKAEADSRTTGDNDQKKYTDDEISKLKTSLTNYINSEIAKLKNQIDTIPGSIVRANGIRITVGSSFPSSPTNNKEIFVNTSNRLLYYYSGNNWIILNSIFA